MLCTAASPEMLQVSTLFRLMLVIARDCPAKQTLMLESWVSPLLYMLADAAATEDFELGHCAVGLLRACVDSGINSVSCSKVTMY